MDSANQTPPLHQLWTCVPSTSPDLGWDWCWACSNWGTKFGITGEEDRKPAQYCRAWPDSIVNAVSRTQLGASCGNAHVNTSGTARARTQTRTCIPSHSSLLSHILVSKWEGSQGSTAGYFHSFLLLYPMRRSSLCSGWGNSFAETVWYETIEVTASKQRGRFNSSISYSQPL